MRHADDAKDVALHVALGQGGRGAPSKTVAAVPIAMSTAEFTTQGVASKHSKSIKKQMIKPKHFRINRSGTFP